MRNLLVFVALAAVGVVLAGCPDDKKDANAPAASSTAAATASASASATPKAAGTGDNKGSGW
jgi:uncharacterized lipoprotein YbaY